MELLALVLSTFAAALVAPLLHRRLPGVTPWLLALVPAGVAAWLLRALPEVSHGGVVESSWAWLPGAGVALALRLDGLGLLFGVLISVIGLLVTLYAGSYLHGHAHRGRFFLYLYLFMGAMLGVVLADDLIALFVFWELTSLSSFFLIGFREEDAESRRSAMQALLVTGLGGLALLAGLILLNVATGATTLSGVNTAGSLAGAPLATPILLLVLLGAFTKSAQFPFHFWLPGAMVAPTPVSAYLHSATMVKAGVYLLARLHPALSGVAGWTPLVAGFGFATLALGTVMALRRTDLKQVLAYSTVASLGFMVFLLGLGSKHAVEGAVAYLLAHALWKGALFLIAGVVDHGTGTRDVTRLGRLRHTMPVTAAAALAAGLSFTGLPPLFGFVAKEVAFNAVLDGPGGWLLLGATALLFVGGVLAAGIVAVAPFWMRAAGTPPHEVHEGGPTLLAGPVVLAAACLLFGFAPGLADEALVSPAASAVLGETVHAHLALWHGFEPVLLVSAAVVAAGFLLLPRAAAVRGWLERSLAPLDRVGPLRAYHGLLAAVDRGARVQTRFWQHGRLRLYLAVTVAFATAATLATWALRDRRFTLPDLDFTARPFEALLVVAMVAAAFAVTRIRSRLGAIALLGTVGYSIALVFLLFGAPDLAMTQFLFETLSVLIFLLVLWGMPKMVPRSSNAARLRDALLAGAVGITATFLVLTATTHSFHEPISSFYRATSYAEAHGRNVVNVILVDFRGLDTLGEITVLGVAALGVAALLRLRPGAGDSE